MIITNKGQSFALDQIVKVQLKQVDWARKQIQFALIPEESDATNDDE